MTAKSGKFAIAMFTLLVIALGFNLSPDVFPQALTLPTPSPTAQNLIRKPETLSVAESPLKASILSAGDYIVRQQLENGELAYQVNFQTGEREYSPSIIRLIGGTGALYTVCRVSGNLTYCEAGDHALTRYLESVVIDPQRFTGACLYANGVCPLSASVNVIDAIYRRWQATGNFKLGNQNVGAVAVELGKFILSLRKPEGDFFYAFDPHIGGGADPKYDSRYAPDENLLALIQLYEMTDNPFWLAHARDVNRYMLNQPVTEDYWHGYAFAMLARLDSLSVADKRYAAQIAETVIQGEVRSLDIKNSSIASATKIEALATLAQAFYLSGQDSKMLDDDLRAFVTFVHARQLPENNCDWELSEEVTKNYDGGIYNTCEDPTIRIDGLQHYINGVAAYLEYQALLEGK
ncbi:MAG: hypothetical protein IT310_13235 [Anaerolineales bacterium]|nr:hypothetical protein [Anaerolineales bacterium]